MTKLNLSPAAAALLRALLARAGVGRHRIFLTQFRSIDWQSLTFVGERHEMELRIPAPNAQSLVERLIYGVSDTEFAIPRQIVADIGMDRHPIDNADGSISVFVEALTIAE